MYQHFLPGMNPRYNRCSNNVTVSSETMEFARAYILRQPYGELVPLNVALKRGSIFSNINLKYPRN